MIDVLIVGAGPSGLYAADKLSSNGLSVRVVERKRAPARKFLLAGRGGLNLTHSEPLHLFKTRYREAEAFLSPCLDQFSPDDLRGWCHGLGQDTFVGSSGRVFPRAMKASPLLRALLQRLSAQRVAIDRGVTWTGFNDTGSPTFTDESGETIRLDHRCVLLTLGGASWPHLGADGLWRAHLTSRGVMVQSFQPANCGFKVAWSDHLIEKCAGEPLKRIGLSIGDHRALGEAMISRTGLEGGAVYALSAEIRSAITNTGQTSLLIDLRPDLDAADLAKRLEAPRGKQSMASFLRKAAGLSKTAQTVLREAGSLPEEPASLARRIKAVPLTATAPYPIDRAISSAGGIALDEVDRSMMLTKMPGVFVAGEMLDWEAPTGGYLLQACFSTAHAAAAGIEDYLKTDAKLERQT